jgi:malate dehydrogenase (oxaloacetate-decarboxylating)(NADP+)
VLGARRENIWVADIEGVVYAGRQKLMDPYKAIYAQATEKRKLAEVMAAPTYSSDCRPPAL